MQQHQIPKSFVCPICNLKLANESEHREHLELHEGKPDIQCAICNKIYKTKSHLKAHIKCHVSRTFYYSTVFLKTNSISNFFYDCRTG